MLVIEVTISIVLILVELALALYLDRRIQQSLTHQIPVPDVDEYPPR
jgi:hypothetical protein